MIAEGVVTKECSTRLATWLRKFSPMHICHRHVQSRLPYAVVHDTCFKSLCGYHIVCHGIADATYDLHAVLLCAAWNS
jgi:hypothetical protein